MPFNIARIHYSDIVEREDRARQSILSELGRLQARRDRRGGLTEAAQAEISRLAALTELFEPGLYLDPLFLSVREAFLGEFNRVQVDHDPEGAIGVKPSGRSRQERRRQIARVVLVLGTLQLENAPLPPVSPRHQAVAPDCEHSDWLAFHNAFFIALGRAADSIDLAVQVLSLLGERASWGHDRAPVMSARGFARIMERMILLGVPANDTQFLSRLNDALAVEEADNLDILPGGGEESGRGDGEGDSETSWPDAGKEVAPKSPEQIAVIRGQLGALRGAIDQSDLDARQKENAIARLYAVEKLIQAPDPPWRVIVELLTSGPLTAFLNTTAILTLIFGS